MDLGRNWNGKIFGTSTGNLSVKLEGENTNLTGILRHNEVGVDLVTYKIAGSYDGTQFVFTGVPQTSVENLKVGRLEAKATLDPKGNLEGEWETDVGAGGTFFLFPHTPSQSSVIAENIPPQLHIAHYNFGAIGIDHDEIMSVAENIQQEFANGRVVVTVVTNSEQVLFLEDFKKRDFGTDRAKIIRINIQEPQRDDIYKVVSIEFGPQVNLVSVQGGNEAWVLGKLETMKRDLKRFERTYTTNFKRFGFGINQLLLVAAIVFLPSLASLKDRAIFMAGILAITYVINRLHNQYLPFAAIYLSNRPPSLLARIGPTILSWVISVTASAAAVVLGAYLKGWLDPPVTSLPN